jgi:hypothetical protein
MPRHNGGVEVLVEEGSAGETEKEDSLIRSIRTRFSAHTGAFPCLDLRCIHPAPVDNSNSGHNQRRSVAVPHAPAYCLRSSAAMACPSGRVGEQLERHADKHRFPMRIRPGDRPPVQRFANRPLNVELQQALEGRSGNWAALRLSGRHIRRERVRIRFPPACRNSLRA